MNLSVLLPISPADGGDQDRLDSGGAGLVDKAPEIVGIDLGGHHPAIVMAELDHHVVRFEGQHLLPPSVRAKRRRGPAAPGKIDHRLQLAFPGASANPRRSPCCTFTVESPARPSTIFPVRGVSGESCCSSSDPAKRKGCNWLGARWARLRERVLRRRTKRGRREWPNLGLTSTGRRAAFHRRAARPASGSHRPRLPRGLRCRWDPWRC